MGRDRFMLSIVIPTLGRATLEATLVSIADQLADDDEVLIAADPLGDVHLAGRLAREILGLRAALVGPGGDWGHTQRNWGIDHATGDYIWCLADDDVAAPDALAYLRAAAGGGWHIFRVESVGELGSWVIPGDHVIRKHNVDAECILAPRSARSRWGNNYYGDLDYAVALRDELGEPVWHEQIVAYLRPATA